MELFLTNVIADSIALEYKRVSLGVLTLSRIFSEEIFVVPSKLDLAFRDKIFFTDSDNLLIGILPLFSFSAIRLIPLVTSVDIKIISFPTSKALRSTLIVGSWRTPFMSSASVTVIPVNLYSSLKRLFIVFFDNEEGYFLSKAGTLRWAVITDSTTPSSINFLKGYNSTSLSLFILPLITGSVLWESLSVSPWPGKCLTDVNTPASLWPFM